MSEAAAKPGGARLQAIGKLLVLAAGLVAGRMLLRAL